MTKLLEIYTCQLCDNMVEVVRTGKGQLVCCNQPMEALPENTADEGHEKHVPVVEQVTDGFRVVVGSTEHPMLDKHFIEWIQVLADGKAYREFLKPGQRPEAVFKLDADQVTAREFCNLHGLWKA